MLTRGAVKLAGLLFDALALPCSRRQRVTAISLR